MPAVSLTINGRLYEVVCDDTQVERVRMLAAQLDGRAQELLSSLGTQPEARMLLMLALTLADEMDEVNAARGAAEARLVAQAETQARMTRAVSELTERIESIARRMERS